MKLKVALGCSICGFVNENVVNLPFDCDKLVCPMCGESCCLSIVSVSETVQSSGKHMERPVLRDLYKIRQL